MASGEFDNSMAEFAALRLHFLWRPTEPHTYPTEFDNEGVHCTTTDSDKVEYIPVIFVEILIIIVG